MRTRKNSFLLRLNDEEYNHLQNMVEMSGLNRESLLRSLIMGKQIQEKPPIEMPQLLRHLSSMGNNINQIARIANSDKSIDPKTLEEIKTMQSVLWQKIKGM